MTYRIVRFKRNSYEPQEVIRKGLTLEEAEEHCCQDDTHGDGWFDGYQEESE